MIRFEIIIDTLKELEKLDGTFINKTLSFKPDYVDVFCKETDGTYFFDIKPQANGWVVVSENEEKPGYISLDIKDILGEAYEQKTGDK